MNDFLQSLRNGQAEKPRTPKTRKNYDNPYHHTSTPRFHSHGNGFSRPSQQMKRPMPGAPQQGGNQAPIEESVLLADAIENLTSHIETQVKTMEYMASVQERMAEMFERQAIAIERIVNHLNINQLPEEEATQEFENHYVSSTQEEMFLDEPAPPDPVRKYVRKEPVRKASREAEQNKTKPAKPVLRKRKKATAPKTGPHPGNTELMGRDQIMDIIHTMREEGATFDQVAKHLVDLGQPTFSGRGEWHAQTVHRLCNRK